LVSILRDAEELVAVEVAAEPLVEQDEGAAPRASEVHRLLIMLSLRQ
jgi:hypothetical protein